MIVATEPIAVDWSVTSPKVRAILDAFQPGELGGDADDRVAKAVRGSGQGLVSK